MERTEKSEPIYTVTIPKDEYQNLLNAKFILDRNEVYFETWDSFYGNTRIAVKAVTENEALRTASLEIDRLIKVNESLREDIEELRNKKKSWL